MRPKNNMKETGGTVMDDSNMKGREKMKTKNNEK